MIASDLLVGIGYIVATLVVLDAPRPQPDQRGRLGRGGLRGARDLAASTLGNILGGIALQLDGSIHEGDWIQLENGKQGKVRAVRWRHTIVETRDWSTIVVPNAQLLANNITILGKRDGVAAPQRMWVWFNVDFRFAPTRVIQVVTDAVLDSPIENVAADPPPNCVCMDFTHDMRESVRDVRRALLARRSRARRPDELARARPHLHRAPRAPASRSRSPRTPRSSRSRTSSATQKRDDAPARRAPRARSRTVHLFQSFTRRRAAHARRGHEPRDLHERRGDHAPGRGRALALRHDVAARPRSASRSRRRRTVRAREPSRRSRRPTSSARWA